GRPAEDDDRARPARDDDVGGAEARMMSLVVALVLGAFMIAAVVRYVQHRRAIARLRAAALDDDEIREIERTGRLAARDPEDDAPRDLEEIAAVEEEFWAEEGWDEPEEYGR